MTEKFITLTKKVDGTEYIVFPKTSANIVKYNDTTVKEELDNLNAKIGNDNTDITSVSMDKINSLFNK